MHHYRPLARSMGIGSLLDIAPYSELARVLVRVRDETGKPVAVVMPDYRQGTDSLDIEELIRHARQALVESRVPVFPELPQALAAIGRVSSYAALHRARALKVADR